MHNDSEEESGNSPNSILDTEGESFQSTVEQEGGHEGYRIDQLVLLGLSLYY